MNGTHVPLKELPKLLEDVKDLSPTKDLKTLIIKWATVLRDMVQHSLESIMIE
jgi:hypothetical protein